VGNNETVEIKMTASAARKTKIILGVIGLSAIGTAFVAGPANAWWYPYGYGPGIYAPPAVVAPPPVYYPPPGYYAPPARVWVPAHWQGNYWVPGHWS
jgi:hypothetical protein